MTEPLTCEEPDVLCAHCSDLPPSPGEMSRTCESCRQDLRAEVFGTDATGAAHCARCMTPQREESGAVIACVCGSRTFTYPNARTDWGR